MPAPAPRATLVAMPPSALIPCKSDAARNGGVAMLAMR
jgi:hypothetical protein